MAGLIVLFIIVTRLLNFYIDYLWFGEVGFRTVLWRSILFQLAVGFGAFVLFFAIVWPNVEFARRSIPEFHVGGDVIDIVRGRARRWLFWIGLAVSLLAALIAGITGSRSWLTFVNAFYGQPFGRKDPIFGHDLGFYVFTVPAWHDVQQFVFAAVLVALIFAAIIHLGLGGAFGSSMQQGQDEEQRPRPLGRQQMPRPNISFTMPPKASMHLSALLGVLFVIIGLGQFFKMWGYLQSQGALFPGAGYTDVHARIPAAWILMVAAFLIAALLFFNIWRRVKWWPWTIAGWVGIFILAQLIYPAIIQSLVVSPNQLAKESQYIGYGLAGTKSAYKLDKIRTVPQPTKKGLTAEALKRNEATIRNIRLWDPGTLLTSYRQLQELKPYYSFVDVDVDRYKLQGKIRQTMLSPRELNIAGLPSTAQTWVNQHITYTHGYGLALSAVNQVTPDGSPDFLVKDIPPAVSPTALPELRITQPRIYYGEIGTDYTLVDTKQREFDFPGKGGDVYTRYRGKGGIQVSSFVRRLALTWHFRTLKFFTSSDITAKSRIILRNNIVDRLAKAAPFLRQDSDPYMVVANGRLWWVVDCYTTTGLYPYSESQGGYNYIRNSVKAVIDAYNGTIALYVFDPADPILRTYEHSFPGIFRPMSQIPAELIKHIRYPEGYFNAQSNIWATYHVDKPETFYNKGNQWQIPNNVSLSGNAPMPAFYVVLELPGETQAEFTLILPYVPNGRPNMIAWLGARSDVPNYGKALTIQFSQGSTVYGPAQAEAAINQDPTVSAQKTLWNQAGSRVILGNLLVEPIEDSLLYVQPLYLQAESTKLPQLKQVVVFYRSATGSVGGVQGQYVSMKPTLGEALTDIFGTAAGAGTPTPSPSGGGTPTPTPSGTAAPGNVRALIQQANQQFNAAQDALKAGDFAEYGRLVKQLQATLQQLARTQQ